MVSRIRTICFKGIDVEAVDVQVHLASGIPAFNIVGLPDKAIAESKERIRSAFDAIGLALPAKRITVNLSPANLRKEGTHYDLPIALGLMVALEIISQSSVDNSIVMGELALDGAVTHVTGVLPAAVYASKNAENFICPYISANEATCVNTDMHVLAPKNIIDLVNYFKGKNLLPPVKNYEIARSDCLLDISDIKGQKTAKRAVEIVAAGCYNMLLIGPPGIGKSMLAESIPSVLPPMELTEALECSSIHSLAGNLPRGDLIVQRPFRAPHHSSSMISMIGGGSRAMPGEASLAHSGVLFLDEFPEFSRACIECLRQPLESGKVTIARAEAHISYPAKFQLIAAMNPCPCGYYDEKQCKCNQDKINKYWNKISGPILDRIEILCYMSRPLIGELERDKGESSQTIMERVTKASKKDKERKKNMNNGELESALSDKAKNFLKKAAEKFSLSARAYYKTIKVAGTIADLEDSTEILPEYIAEALSYRINKEI